MRIDIAESHRQASKHAYSHTVNDIINQINNAKVSNPAHTQPKRLCTLYAKANYSSLMSTKFNHCEWVWQNFIGAKIRKFF